MHFLDLPMNSGVARVSDHGILLSVLHFDRNTTAPSSITSVAFRRARIHTRRAWVRVCGGFLL